MGATMWSRRGCPAEFRVSSERLDIVFAVVAIPKLDVACCWLMVLIKVEVAYDVAALSGRITCEGGEVR